MRCQPCGGFEPTRNRSRSAGCAWRFLMTAGRRGCQGAVDVLERDVGSPFPLFEEDANRLLPRVWHVVTGVTSNDLVQLGISAVALKPVPIGVQRSPPKCVATQRTLDSGSFLSGSSISTNRVDPVRSASGLLFAVPQKTERLGMRSVPLPYLRRTKSVVRLMNAFSFSALALRVKPSNSANSTAQH